MITDSSAPTTIRSVLITSDTGSRSIGVASVTDSLAVMIGSFPGWAAPGGPAPPPHSSSGTAEQWTARATPCHLAVELRGVRAETRSSASLRAGALAVHSDPVAAGTGENRPKVPDRRADSQRPGFQRRARW